MTARVAWAAGSHRVVLELSHPSLEPVARALFPDDQVPPPGGEPTLTLEERPGSRYRLRLPWGARDVETRGEVWVHVEMALAELLLRETRGVRVLHGGGVRIGGGAVIFTGYGGAGKSTLTAAAALTGLSVYGDDALLLEDATGLVRPFRRLLKLHEDARRLLGVPRPGGPLDELWPHAAFYRPADLGSRWAEPARPAAVLFPDRGAGEGEPRLVDLAGGEAMHRLLRQVLLHEADGVAFGTLAASLAGARTAELRYADARDAVAALRGLLGDSSRSTSSPVR